MTGANLFVNPNLTLFERRHGADSVGPRTAVFISYSHVDRDKAREIADALHEAHIDYYFDEDDEALQAAAEQSHHLKVVNCIDAGITHCTHLLGIITENTKDSWWVPYEIGNALGRNRECAHLIDRKVKALPSYIQTATILPSRSALREWLPKESDQPASRTMARKILFELRTLTAITAADYLEFVSPSRSVSEISFY